MACLGNLIDENVSVIGFFDDNPNASLLDLPHLGKIGDALDRSDLEFVIGVGDHDFGRLRNKVFEALRSREFAIRGFASKSCRVQTKIIIPNSVQLFPMTFIGLEARIGENSIINTRSTIEHESIIGESVSLGPNVTICGNARIGNQVIIGASSTVLPLVKVEAKNIIGAKTLVNKDIIGNGGIYAGIPARKVGEIPT